MVNILRMSISIFNNINFRKPGNKDYYVCIAIIFLLPFLMFSWIMPFISRFTLGNDYSVFSIGNQMELMFALKTGTFPLFIPGFGGGQSFSALTTGQVFHPITYIKAILPGYWTGKALEWNTFFRILSLGVVQFFLFKFLRNLRFNSTISLILSTIAVYNMRSLDLFRYGSALESWTGYLLLCASIGLYCIRPTKLKGLLAIIGSTYWLVCSGHPQNMYYGFIGGIIFTIIIPFYINSITQQKMEGKEILHFWAVSGFASFIGILLSSAYLLPFYFDFLATNAGRVNQGYQWANTFCDTFSGTINNFFQPLHSDVHGAFGGSSLFLVAALIPFLKLFRVKIPKIIWIVWGISLIAFLHMQGERLPIHYYTWKYFPLASSTRIAGRISFILPVFLMLLLGWVFKYKTKISVLKFNHINISCQTVLSIVSIFALIAYLLLPESIVENNTQFWATSIRQIHPYIEGLVYFVGMISIAIFFLHGQSQKKNRSIEYLLFSFVCLQLFLIFPYATWISKKQETPSYMKMLAQKKRNLTQHVFTGYGLSTKTITAHGRETSLEPFLGKIYQKYLVAKNNRAAYKIMRKDRSPDEVVLENYQPGQCFLGNEMLRAKYANSGVDIQYASFNRLVFNVYTVNPGFFGLAFPYSLNWNATVNHSKATILRANGAYMAVCLPPGKSSVEFRYTSTAMISGMIVSCLTLFLLGVVISMSSFKKPSNFFAMIVFLVISSGLFLLWFSSLYTGENLSTEYHWYSKEPSSLPNLAYGKEVILSSIHYTEFDQINSGGKAVDGDYSPRSGIRTAFQKKPSLTINLFRPKLIGSVKVFGALKGEYFNIKPLEIRFALNPDKWVSMKLNEINGIMQISLKRPIKAKYVQLRASGKCILALDEVEIFPPER